MSKTQKNDFTPGIKKLRAARSRLKEAEEALKEAVPSKFSSKLFSGEVTEDETVIIRMRHDAPNSDLPVVLTINQNQFQELEKFCAWVDATITGHVQRLDAAVKNLLTENNMLSAELKETMALLDSERKESTKLAQHIQHLKNTKLIAGETIIDDDREEVVDTNLITVEHDSE